MDCFYDLLMNIFKHHIGSRVNRGIEISLIHLKYLCLCLKMNESLMVWHDMWASEVFPVLD